MTDLSESIPTEEADFVIVGGGTAGCVLANRLSSDGRHRVAMIEAGGEARSPWIQIPLGYGKLYQHPKLSWLFTSAPEAELGGRGIAIPRGRVLGGSSSTNGLLYIRGQAQDFDGWAEAGNPGWSFADVLPYFRKAEDQQRGSDEWHGVGGPLAVSDPAARHELAEAFIAAAGEVGIPRNEDFNGAFQEGAGYYQMTARRGTRCSTAAGYLRPARRRPNLRVLTDARATRLLFEGRRVIGVEYRRGGRIERLNARRELILSGGAIHSPQLLQLSGVGDAAAVAAWGVTPVHDLPGVGRSLQDHANVRISYRSARPITINDRLSSPLGYLGVGLEYLLWRKGPLTVSAGFAGAFYRTEPSLELPDVQGYFLLFRTDKSGAALEPFSGFMGSAYQLRPESRGTIGLAGPDPLADPVIRPNYLTTEIDRRVTLNGVKRLRDIFAAPAMAPYVAGCEPEAGVDDDALMAYIRERAGSAHHFTSSCRMGSDDHAVVDAGLRVRGMEGLRVVDGSIMPSIVSGNTAAPIVMIAEKGADMILEDARG